MDVVDVVLGGDVKSVIWRDGECGGRWMVDGGWMCVKNSVLVW